MIAVTGGAGFIGTQLVEYLKGQGHAVRILDVSGSTRFPEDSRTVDVRDGEALQEALQGCGEIYHLAAEHRDDVFPPSRYYEVNCTGTANVVKAAERLGIGTVVFTSTVAVYGLDRGESDESSEPAPFNDYGRSKLQAEGILREWAGRNPGRRLVIARLTATFGPGNRGNIHRLIAEVHGGRFVMVGSGRNVKSIAYVKNVATFLCQCRDLPPGTATLNYADKPDLTTRQLVETVRHASGRSGAGPRVPLAVGLAGGVAVGLLKNRDPGTVPVILSRIKKFSANTVVRTSALETIGYRPPFSLAQALQETVAAEFGARG